MSVVELRRRLDRLGLQVFWHRRCWVVVRPRGGLGAVQASFAELAAVPAWLEGEAAC